MPVVMVIQPMTAINCMFCLASLNSNSPLQLLAQVLRPPSHPVSRNISLNMVGATMLINPEVNLRDILLWLRVYAEIQQHITSPTMILSKIDLICSIISSYKVATADYILRPLSAMGWKYWTSDAELGFGLYKWVSKFALHAIIQIDWLYKGDEYPSAEVFNWWWLVEPSLICNR